MARVEVAAIIGGDGTFELMRLDEQGRDTVPIDRIQARDNEELEQAMHSMLPALSPADALQKALAGAVFVQLENWLRVKRALATVPKRAMD